MQCFLLGGREKEWLKSLSRFNHGAGHSDVDALSAVSEQEWAAPGVEPCTVATGMG